MKYRNFLIMMMLGTVPMSSASQSKSGNPIFEGWYADPEGVVFEKEYWIYPTYSAPYDEQIFIDAFSSKNLVEWEKHHSVLSAKDVNWAKRAMWAPAIIYANDKYYLFFGANDIQCNGESGGIGVATADNPSGPFKDALGKPLIDKIVNGAQPIDQFVFKDDDGQYYMYYGGWGHCNMVKLSSDLLSVVPSVATGAGHHSVIKGPGEDEWYIVYHRRPLGETEANSRVTCIDRLYFDDNGYIKPVKMTFEGVSQSPL